MKNKYLTLFFEFFKIGAATFGGGLAMIPIMADIACNKHHWVTEAEILDMVVVSEATPGVLAVNLATYIGYKVGKFWGSVIATLSVVLPSIIIIILISLFLNQFKEAYLLQNILLGIKAGVVVLIFRGVKKLAKAVDKNIFSLILFLASLTIGIIFNFPTILVILAAAVIGIVAGLISKEIKVNIHD